MPACIVVSEYGTVPRYHRKFKFKTACNGPRAFNRPCSRVSEIKSFADQFVDRAYCMFRQRDIRSHERSVKI